jgi:hypothetical protein
MDTKNTKGDEQKHNGSGQEAAVPPRSARNGSLLQADMQFVTEWSLPPPATDIDDHHCGSRQELHDQAEVISMLAARLNNIATVVEQGKPDA